MTHRRFLAFRRADGQTMTEYAMLLVLLVLVVIGVLPLFGASVLHLFTTFQNAFGG